MNETPVMKPSRNVIWENLISIYPGAVLYGLLFNVSLMIDSIIAGQSLGAGGIAAVALGVPGYGAPAAADYFAENIVMGIQNNLILAGFPGDAMILPVCCYDGGFDPGNRKRRHLAVRNRKSGGRADPADTDSVIGCCCDRQKKRPPAIVT